MLVHDTRLILAGVDVSYIRFSLAANYLTATLRYTQYFEDFYRRVPEADLKSILKFESIPIMLVSKHPERGNTINHTNGIIIFEGLMQGMSKQQLPGTNTYEVTIKALRLSEAVLTDIKYTGINVGTAFSTLDNAKAYNITKTTAEVNAQEKLANTTDIGGLRNTDQIFLKRLLQGTSKFPEVTRPHEVYQNTLENLLAPIEGAVFGSDPFAIGSRKFLMTGEATDPNFFWGSAAIKKAVDSEEEDIPLVKPTLVEHLYNITKNSFFKDAIPKSDFKDIRNVLQVWRDGIDQSLDYLGDSNKDKEKDPANPSVAGETLLALSGMLLFLEQLLDTNDFKDLTESASADLTNQLYGIAAEVPSYRKMVLDRLRTVEGLKTPLLTSWKRLRSTQWRNFLIKR